MEKLFNLKAGGGAASTSGDSSAYATQAEHLWSMLDDMAANSPESYKKFIEKTLKEGKESMKPPQANMCVRARLRETSFKTKEGSSKDLYVNFFAWNRIPEPKSDEEPIPVYGRPVNFDKSKSFVNIAFNPAILAKYGKDAAESEEERGMLVELAFEFVERQNQVRIDRSGWQLVEGQLFYGPSLAECVADLTKGTNVTTKEAGSDLDLAKDALSYLRDSGTQLPDSLLSKISSLDLNKPSAAAGEQATPPTTKPLIQEVEAPAVEPTFEAKVVPSKSNENECIYDLKIYLPKVDSISECALEIENEKEDFLTLNFANKNLYKQLKISLVDLKRSYRIDSTKVAAKFAKKSHVLHVKLPLARVAE